MHNEYINIVLTGDKNYVTQIGVTMYSIVHNLSADRCAHFFLFVSDWNEADKREIQKLQNCKITIIDITQHLHYFQQVDLTTFKLEYIKSLSPYYRLLIPKILPTTVEKAFYIDADIIVDDDLAPIYDEMPDNKLLSAVIELVANADIGKVLNHLSEWKEFDDFNKDPRSAPYFNAGFFLMNIKLARELNVFDDFMKFLELHPNPPYCDQDILNAVCGQKHKNKMIYLPPKWNVFCDMVYNLNVYAKAAYNHHEVKYAFEYPSIYHYAGENKPWINDKVKNYYDVWHNYCELSPFEVSHSISRTLWISVFLLPIIKIRISKVNMSKKYYLFGFFPLYKELLNGISIYLLGIPFIKIRKNPYRVKLFGFIPFISSSNRSE